MGRERERTENGALVELLGAGKRYGRHAALTKVDVSLRRGEAVAIWGANGSGKSTLLYMLGGLSALSEGRRIAARAPGGPIIGFAPDRLPALRFGCADYVRRLGELRGMKRREAADRVRDLLARFGMADHGEVQLRHCSKGMLQKVNLMQALLPEPELLLLDEPLSGLDANTQAELVALLARLKAEGIAIAFATHEPELAAQVADRMLVLQGGTVLADVRTASLGEPAKAIDCLPAAGSGGPIGWEREPGVLAVRPMPDGSVRCTIRDAEADRWMAGLLRAGGSIRRVEPVGGAEKLIAAIAGGAGVDAAGLAAGAAGSDSGEEVRG